MKILKGTFFQRNSKQNEFSMIGFVTLDHPVKDDELYHLYNNSISHTPNHTLTDDYIIQGIHGILTNHYWPIYQIGFPVRFICVDSDTDSYIVYSASPYPFTNGEEEQFFIFENNKFINVESLTQTKGKTLDQLLTEPLWSNLNFNSVSIISLDKISFNFYSRGYPLLKQFVNDKINQEEFINKLNMNKLESVYFKKFTQPDNTYKQFLKFRLENFSFSRITQKENLEDKEKALATLVKSLI